MNIKSIQKQLSDFADERDWDQFHNPKNLAMALSVEASELVEIFQWCIYQLLTYLGIYVFVAYPQRRL